MSEARGGDAAGGGGAGAPMPVDEAARLRTLERYGILDSGRDTRFEELAAEVARVLGTPIATITFVDATRQWFKAAVGVPFEQTDRDVAFCAHTILEPDRMLVVEDARKDPRFADNPLVVGDPHLVAYAGAPMVAPDGNVIGTVCAMDHEPRTYTPDQLAVLRRVAAQVVELVDTTSTADRLLGADLEVLGDIATDGGADEVLALTRPLIEAIGEDVDIDEVLGSFCATVIDTFGWWAARIARVQGDVLWPSPWTVAQHAPPVLARLAALATEPVDLEDLAVRFREPAVHDVGALPWLDGRDVVAGVGGRSAVVLDVPGAHSLAARLVFLLPSSRALSDTEVRTLTTAATVLPRVFVQDRARRELTYRATHDLLTGLLNREGLARRYPGVGGEGTADRPTGRAMLYLDLDGLKAVNDTFGHRAGDEVLARVARQVSGSIRPTDTAARLGGDEFVVVLDGVLDADEALQVARRLVRALRGTRTTSPAGPARITVSVGVTMWEPGMTLDAVIDAADGLMYAAKVVDGSAIVTDGPGGRRLLGADEDDDRDLDLVLSGAVHVAVAPVVDRDGELRAHRATLSAEVRHPSVDDLAELVLRGVRPHLVDLPDDERLRLVLGPSSLLWETDGLVLRLLVALTVELPGVALQLVVAPEDGNDATVREANRIRDALGVGLVVGRFGAPGAPGASGGDDLLLVERLAPVALELDVGVLASGVGGASSGVADACVLATTRGLELLIPCVPEHEPADLFAVLDTSCGEEVRALLVDHCRISDHRRGPAPARSHGSARSDGSAEDRGGRRW